MLAYVEPGCPFFPSAYHSGPDSLAIGLQGAGIVAEALRTLRGDETSPLDLVQISEVVKTAVIEQAKPVVDMAQEIAPAHGLIFGGIDLSPAPLGEERIIDAMELCGYGAAGTPGALAGFASLILTTALVG